MPQIDPPEFVPEDNDSRGAPNPTNPTEIEEILSQPARKATAAKLRVFLDTYSRTGYVNQSCEAAGIARDTHYHKLETDPVYRRAFEKAQAQAGDMLEDLAVQRVREGIQKQLFYQGEPVMLDGEYVYETTYDSHLHHVLLKRFKANEYRERVTQEITGTINIIEILEAGRQRVLQMRRSLHVSSEPTGTA